MNDSNGTPGPREIDDLFGALRAEEVGKGIYDHFTMPQYWPALLSPRACFLTGGRGTGKTTTLLALSYQGQRRLEGDDPLKWRHLGLYWKIDASFMPSLGGPELEVRQWQKLFAHYVNLCLVDSILGFVSWLEEQGIHKAVATVDGIEGTCRAFGLPPARDLGALAVQLRPMIVDFEHAVNNVADGPMPQLSVLGRPVEHLLNALAGDPLFRDRPVFFLVDEYETLGSDHQRVLNTLIKSSPRSLFTFKVGVRHIEAIDLHTLVIDQPLQEPSDYSSIDIPATLIKSGFGAFASQVCNERFRALGVDLPGDTIEELLPTLSAADEARLLSTRTQIRSIRQLLLDDDATLKDLEAFDRLDEIDVHFLNYWHMRDGESVVALLRSMLAEADRDTWANRRNNYQNAALFGIRSGLIGVRKYYCGWDVFLLLAAGNIRYLLLLVEGALVRSREEQGDVVGPVSPLIQTQAAQAAALTVFRQLPRVTSHGVQVSRLVLGLGRVLQILAADPHGHTPEVNQFRVSNPRPPEADEILDAAVNADALVAFQGDKMARLSGETRDLNYMLHPMFAPMFTFSHRRKRRMTITGVQVTGLVERPQVVITEVARAQGRSPGDLPEQLLLFKDFYDDAN